MCGYVVFDNFLTTNADPLYRAVPQHDPKMGISQKITFKWSTYYVVYLQTERLMKSTGFLYISQILYHLYSGHSFQTGFVVYLEQRFPEDHYVYTQ